MSKTGQLNLENQNLELPLVEGTRAEKAVDISALRKTTGHVTLDIGYVNTANCYSSITFLNGEEGILQYRGIPIEILADKSDFLESSFLLINGRLPTASELKEFTSAVNEAGTLEPRVKNLIKSLAPTAHPMGSLSAVLVSLSGFYPELGKEDLSAAEMDRAFVFLLGQMKSIIAALYRHSKGLDFVESKASDAYAHDFLSMMFAEKVKEFPTRVPKAMDVLCLLHADHEQNCSTTTVRTIGSAKGNVFSSIAGGVNALWGSLHGGANQAVIEMLENIAADGSDVDKYVAKAKDKNDPFRIMGFGHRVYKNFDPRATIIKEYCNEILSLVRGNDPLLEIAKKLEIAALEDEYFIQRKLYPNVDFYSGLIYRALGIPTDMFTTIFALGRLPGWLAQWKEQREDKGMRITRPRQIYQGEADRSYTPVNER